MTTRHDHYRTMLRRTWAALSANPLLSRRALADALGLRSSHGAQRWVDALERTGYIRRHADRPGVEVVVPLLEMER